MILDRYRKKYFIKFPPTRGLGRLEGFLSRMRASKAKKCLYKSMSGKERRRLVDIGCGLYPVFLLTSGFREKYGLDQFMCERDSIKRRITYYPFDMCKGERVPFETGFADAVTMLAVFEHLDADRLPFILKEVGRVLRPGGHFFMTTPATWSKGVLFLMTKMNLVSAEETDEHRTNLSSNEIKKRLYASGFENVRSGYFELFLNRWFLATKGPKM